MVKAPALKGGFLRDLFLRSGCNKDLGVPLTLEGPTWTMRGVPPGGCDLSHGDRRTRRERDGLDLLVWRVIGA